MPQPKVKEGEYLKLLNKCLVNLGRGLPVNEFEFRRACKEVKKINSTRPNDPDILNLLGMMACIDGDKELSRNMHKMTVNMKPGYHEFYSNFAVSMMHLKDFDLALENLEKAIKLKPKLSYHIRLIEILEAKGEIGKALKYAKDLLSSQFIGNKELIGWCEDLEDYEQVNEAFRIANDPKTEYVSLDKAI